MKKLAIMIMAGMMTLSMAACGNQGTTTPSTKTTTLTQQQNINLSVNTVVALERCYNNLKSLDDTGMVIYGDIVTFKAEEGEVVCLKVGCAEYEGVIDGTEVEISFDEYGLVDGTLVESDANFIGAREWYLSADKATQKKASEKFTCYNAAQAVKEMKTWKGYEKTYLAEDYVK